MVCALPLAIVVLMHEAHMIKEWYVAIIIHPKNVFAFVILKGI